MNGQSYRDVEEAVATPQELAIQELNVGVYCFNANWLWDALPRVPISPKGEYFLTDLLAIALSDGKSIQTVNLLDPDEAIGINTRVHLAEAEAVLRKRINTYWMREGVTILDPATTYIESTVAIGQDSIILPNTYLKGNTAIGEGCQIGPNTHSQRYPDWFKLQDYLFCTGKSHRDSRVDIGPFAHLRKGAHLAEGVHMGNFGEIKNSYLGPGTKWGISLI